MRKGQVSPLIMIPIFVVTLLFFSMGSYILYELWDDMRPSFQDRLGDEGDFILNETGGLVDGLGNIFLLILGGVVIWVIIAFMMREEHPVMFVVALLFLLCMVFVGVILGNAFTKLDNDSNMAGASAQFSDSIGLLMNKFVIVILVIIIIAIIVAYVRFKG